MRWSIAIALLAALVACDQLMPGWGNAWQVDGVNPWPEATCADLCELEERLCLEASCGGATVAVYPDLDAKAPDAFVPLPCDAPLVEALGEPVKLSCCCGG